MSQSPALTPVHDTVILGEGVGAVAAALTAQAEGRSCLLVMPVGALAWECGQAFFPEAGLPADPIWESVCAEAAGCGGLHDGNLDGVVGQSLLAERLARAEMPAMEAALPLAVDVDATGLIRGLLVATKQGPLLIRARRWIDASEDGTLVRLAAPGITGKPIVDLIATAAFYHGGAWSDETDLAPTARSDERILRFRPQRADAPWADLPEALARRPFLSREACLGRCSWRAVATYAGGPEPRAVPGNVALAAPALVSSAVRTLADRSALGVRAVALLDRLAQADASQARIPEPTIAESIVCDVVVAGLGTGGSFAALSAAEHGAQVLACEPQPFPGGIGTGGGIHAYYYGLSAGRQLAIDDAVQVLMDLHPGAFGRQQGNGFHPLAKSIILDRVLRKAGVDCRYGHLLTGIERRGDRIVGALLVDGSRIHRLRAAAWIDGTGDGDLCAQAGADLRHGRANDGLYHAYTQAAGSIHPAEGDGRRLGHVNRDAGWCDPRDPADLARARIVGIAQFAAWSRKAAERPIQMFPTLGIRQAAQVVTDTVVTLDDLLSFRRFPDEVGFACANVDNHATDLHWESDEAVFWNWAARNWAVNATCAIPYGALVPVGLDNCWIASRCLGVTQDAHYAIRMQRDIQRIGEVVGAAAALAVARGVASRALPLADILASLGESTLDLPKTLGRFSNLTEIQEMTLAPLADRLAAGLAAIDSGAAGHDLWWLYRNPELCAEAIHLRLASADDHASWFAATVSALWGKDAAQERLLRAISQREWGYDERTTRLMLARNGRFRKPDPNGCNRLAPNWLTAVVLLRCCGDARAMPGLIALAGAAAHLLQVRCALALSAAAICDRDPAARPFAETLAGILARGPVPATIHDPQLGIGALAQRALAGEALPEHDGGGRSDDHGWQLDVAIARLRRAADLPVVLDHLAADPRASVRRAAAMTGGRIRLAAAAGR